MLSVGAPSQVGRNDPCPCGSGKRYKECHGNLATAGAARTADPQLLVQQALRAYRQQDHRAAADLCRRILETNDRDADAWHLLAVVELERADFASAASDIEKAIAIDDARGEFHRILARARYGAGRVDSAAASARRAIELDPRDVSAWNVLGLALEVAQPEQALAAWDQAVVLAPRDPEAHFRIGDFFRRRREFERAVAAYGAALSIAPDNAFVHNNIALALQELGRLDEAEAHYRTAVRLQPTMVEAVANLGDACQATGRFAEAITWFTKAIERRPNAAVLWAKLGLCRYRLGEMDEAKKSFERARSLDPGDPKASVNLASVLIAQNHYAEALPLIRQALTLAPHLAEAESMLLYVKQQTCEWQDLDYLVEAQRARLAAHDAPPVVPHSLFALQFTPAELLTATRDWVNRHIRPKPAARPPLRTLVDGRLRIAYLGSDFRAHAFASLISEVIETHDRSRFEVIAYSFGPDDGSAARARFLRAFDRFVDVRDEAIEQTVARIRADRIGILFDTGGHVIYARNEIFALRAAPIQINCMFAGTLGADYYDYLMTDNFVTPPGQEPNYVERFLLLPHCYMPSDTRRAIGPRPSRAECGLPDRGIVFCCFNGSYKILPDVFSIWMRLLARFPGSVLWLLDTDPTVVSNLRREAHRHDVAPERLVFAPRLGPSEHLARHAAADLFLDTFPCNAHTTTNDALYAGLPVLTCTGQTFSSRVAASHLHAIGLPELVTDTLGDYEALAFKLAGDPAVLADYRSRLNANRHTSPLFDMKGYTRAFDDLLWGAWERWLEESAGSAEPMPVGQERRIDNGD